VTPRKPTRAKALGVTDAEYARLLEAQGGHCALCPNTPKTRRLHVDHDHATGRVRGLLCYVCNKYLPATRDAAWHRRAADYLTPSEPEYLRRLKTWNPPSLARHFQEGRL